MGGILCDLEIYFCKQSVDDKIGVDVIQNGPRHLAKSRVTSWDVKHVEWRTPFVYLGTLIVCGCGGGGVGLVL